MTEDLEIMAGKTAYEDAKDTAHNISKDPGVKVQHVAGGGKTDYSKPLSEDPPVEEHDMDSEVTTSINQVKSDLPPVWKINPSGRIP